MRTIAGAILTSAAAICITVGGVFGGARGMTVAAIPTIVSGCLGLALLAWGLKTEGRDSGSNS